MKDYNKLLLNIEEDIFYQLKKKDSLLISECKYSQNEIETMMLIKLNSNKEIIVFYFSKFKITSLDIDILNLILKYIDVCKKIVKLEMDDHFGIKIINYHPKNSIQYLDSDYIINKYPTNKKYGWGISKNVIEDLNFIFLNIIIPYACNEIHEIYWVE
jgi:hypothetical protein